MTQTQQNQLKRLFKLIDLSDELGNDLINLKLIDHWNVIREEHGLVLTLQLIKNYVLQDYFKTHLVDTDSLETSNANQDSHVV